MKKVPLSRVFVNDEVREAGMRAMNLGWYILGNEVVTQILSLPIYGDLAMEDVDYVCDAILEFFGKFTTANPSGGENDDAGTEQLNYL